MNHDRFVARHRRTPAWEPHASRAMLRIGTEWDFCGTYTGRRRAPSTVQVQYATVVAAAVIGASVIALAAGSALPDGGVVRPSAGPPAVVAVVTQEPMAAVPRETTQAATRTMDRSPLKAQDAEDYWTPPLREFDLTSFYGTRWGVLHAGIDLAAPTGTTVYAAHRGVVSESGWAGTYGYLVVVDHGGGVQTYYAHNSALIAKAGDKVEAGDPISRVGNTGYSFGPHCHFEVHLKGEKVDPMPYLKKRGLDVEKAARNVVRDDSLVPG